MKRAAVVFSLILLVSSASTVPARAALQQDRGKNRAPFIAQGRTILPGTAQATFIDWRRSCPEMPATQGVTAYIFEIPDGFLTNRSVAHLEGTAVGAGFGYRVWFWDDSCNAHDCCADAPAVVPRAARFIYVTHYFDGASEFELTVTR